MASKTYLYRLTFNLSSWPIPKGAILQIASDRSNQPTNGEIQNAVRTQLGITNADHICCTGNFTIEKLK